MPWHRWCMHISVWGTQRGWGCLCQVLKRTKWLCKMSPVLEAGWNSSCPTNEAILKGEKIRLNPLNSWGLYCICQHPGETAVCQDPSLVSQSLFFLLTAFSHHSNCTVIFVNKSMSLLYLNNRGWHLLWEAVWFSGLVGYFDVNQRKEFT